MLIQSDAIPGPDGQRAMTALSLPISKMWALTATWRADEMSRPGSVWSHTLLLGWPVAGGLRGAAGLLGALRRPTGPNDLNRYREPVEIQDQPIGVPAPVMSLVEVVLLAAYGSPDEAAAVLTPSLPNGERALFAVWEQQWPELRLATGLATRGRLENDESTPLQVALSQARGRPTGAVLDARHPPSGPQPAFVRELVTDIAHPGKLRQFLRRYGNDLAAGRAAMHTLVDTNMRVEAGSPDAVEFIAATFPAANQMERLKIDVLKAADSIWPVGESARVTAAIAAAKNIPYSELQLGPRLARLWPGDPASVIGGLTTARRQGPQKLANELLKSVASAADAVLVSELATVDWKAAVTLCSMRSDILETPALWTGRGAWQERLLTGVSGVDVAQLARALIEADAYELAGRAIDLGAVPPAAVADALIGDRPLASVRDSYRRIFSERVEQAVASASRPDAAWTERVMAALLAPPTNRVVREHADELAAHLDVLDRTSQLELATRLVAAGRQPCSRPVMMETFPVLHRALVENKLSGKQWKSLDKVLPPGNHWDRAERLRKALINSIKNDSWTDEQIAKTLERAGPEAARVRDLTGKKSDLSKIIDDIVDALTFWW